MGASPGFLGGLMKSVSITGSKKAAAAHTSHSFVSDGAVEQEPRLAKDAEDIGPLPHNTLTSPNVAAPAKNSTSAMMTGEALHALLEPSDQYFNDAASRQGVAAANHIVGELPQEVWVRIIGYLPSRLDAANLMFATLGARGQDLDAHRPLHLFCFLCGSFHRRLDAGKEMLRANYVASPIFDCPNAKILTLPRLRLVEGRQLPYSLVQLAMRAHRYGKQYGIPLAALGRKWNCKDSNWTHTSRAHIYKGHLVVKVTSTVFVGAEMTPSEERLLLFSRNDYAPYFSCCHHWANGQLIPLVKCCLSHVPIPRQGLRAQIAEGPRIRYDRLRTPDYMPHLCEKCKPMRRCPQCPTEYLIELKLTEDKLARGLDRFRHALVVTRWSDLGNGTSPSTPEWASCAGMREDYDSFGTVGNLSLCSAFEAAVNNFTPNQRMLSLGTDKPSSLTANLADVVY